ncbi:MAG: integration host factor subunit alpha [Salaquimonas sp.]
MSEETTTRATLADAVHSKVGLSRTESSDMVDLFFDIISDTLVSGEQVKLSKFGNFKINDKNQRIGRNPKTLQEVVITPRRVVTFAASPALKDAVADGCFKVFKLKKTA